VEEGELIGRTIADKYVIDSFLGGGGMGAVYRARQVGLDKLVAVKILHSEFAGEAAFVTRFKREAKAASRIDHPNSMRVLDFGQEPDGLLYIVMEYLAGRSLFRIFRDEAPLPSERIVDLFRQALAALAAAHDLGIVHRDLKPDNIIVMQKTRDEGSAGEHVKVCDFGIAKFTGNTSATAAEKLTADGTIIGTPDYLSPEQARSDDIDARSDLYSMGVMLFEALTGKTPFHADTPLGVVLQHLDTEPPKPSSIAPDVDPKLEAICLRCLKKKPEERFASARDMRAAFAPESIRPASLPAAYEKVAIPRAPKAPVITTRASDPTPQVTPPPVSSTPQPVPLLQKKQTTEPRVRPRLTDVTGTSSEPSGAPGIVFAVLVVLATGGVGVWMYKSGGSLGTSAAPSHVVAASASVSAPPAKPAPIDETLDVGVSFSAAPTAAPSARPTGKPPKGQPASSASASASPFPAGVPTGSGIVTEGPRVVVGSIHSKGVKVADVKGVLPGDAIGVCYRDAMKGGAFAGKGMLHLEFVKGETKASFLGDSAVSRLSGCVEGAARGIVVNGGGDAVASADVDLMFVAQ
jgi:eukaryotic-like serine/threonine-protein kinase